MPTDLIYARTGWCLDESTPFQFPKSTEFLSNPAPLETESACSRSRAYANILGQLLKDIDGTAIMDTDLPLLSMMPLLHLDTLHMRAETTALRRPPRGSTPQASSGQHTLILHV